MDIKTGTELTISAQGFKTPFKSFFVGGKTNQHIVAGFPQDLPSLQTDLKKGRELTIRYTEGESIFEFRTIIREILHDPVDLLIMEYPAKITAVEKRVRKRINCLIEAKFEIVFEENNRLITGIIDNISKTGCNFIIKKSKDGEQSFSLGDRINLRCQFPGFPGEQSGEGKIIRIQETPDEINAGIQFDKELWWIPPYGSNS